MKRAHNSHRLGCWILLDSVSRRTIAHYSLYHISVLKKLFFPSISEKSPTPPQPSSKILLLPLHDDWDAYLLYDASFQLHQISDSSQHYLLNMASLPPCWYYDTSTNGHKAYNEQAPALSPAFYSYDFCMHDCPLQLLARIMPSTNDFSILDNHTTNWILCSHNLSLSKPLS